jgi:hypothetical protein
MVTPYLLIQTHNYNLYEEAISITTIIVVMSVLPMACSERRSEEAQGRETELAGDEPDATPILNEQ